MLTLTPIHKTSFHLTLTLTIPCRKPPRSLQPGDGKFWTSWISACHGNLFDTSEWSESKYGGNPCLNFKVADSQERSPGALENMSVTMTCQSCFLIGSDLIRFKSFFSVWVHLRLSTWPIFVTLRNPWNLWYLTDLTWLDEWLLF